MPERLAPRPTYDARLGELKAQFEKLDASSVRFSFARTVAFCLFVILAAIGVRGNNTIALSSLAPLLLFFVILALHERVKSRIEEVQRVQAFYEAGVARLEGKWRGRGDKGSEFLDPHHPYAADLDLFGVASLFELLSIARSGVGRETLASWLVAAAPEEEIARRRGEIADLRDRVRLRERFATATAKAKRAIGSAAIRRWATGEAVRFSLLERIVTGALAAAGVVTLVLSFLGILRWSPFLLISFAGLLLRARLAARLQAVRQEISAAGDELRLLASTIRLVEEEPFSASTLNDLFRSGRGSASFEIERLVRLLDLLDSMRNQFFAPFGALLHWTPHLVFRLQAWRDRNGVALVEWMHRIGRFEALSSLAGFAFENPSYVEPTLGGDRPHFDATSLAHPLLGPEAVANDVALNGEERLWIISGSNMSGKSTLLRAIGVNAVLAFAGAPVRAKSLHLSDMRIGASIRINDSLQEGSSRFYAEITRIKQIVDLARSGATLFLLDEVFGGTNSHDRRIGAEAVLRTLIDLGAVGLVTTHDLALARLSESLGPLMRNVHFEDHMEEGRISFDYLLKEGVVTRSNALELMRAVGLEV